MASSTESTNTNWDNIRRGVTTLRRTSTTISSVLRNPSASLRTTSASLQIEHKYDDDDDNDVDDDAQATTKVAVYTLCDGVCRSCLDVLASFPAMTLQRIGHLRAWSINEHGAYTFDSTLWKNSWNVLGDIGLSGLFSGVKWQLFDSITNSIIEWGLSWGPRVLNVKVSPQGWWARFFRPSFQRCLVILPRMYFQLSYVTEAVNNKTTTSGSEATNSPAVSLWDIFTVVPWWFVITELLDSSGFSLVTESMGNLKYFLPTSHPLHEKRSYRECFHATPWYWKPSGLFGINYADFEWSQVYQCWIKCWMPDMICASVVSNVFMFPVRAAYTKLSGFFLEDKEHRLVRKIEHATNKTTHGFISMFGEDDNGESPQTSRLLRTSTIALKKKAYAHGHGQKYSALLTRQLEHAVYHTADQSVTIVQLVLSRDLLEESLNTLAHCDVYALKIGKVRVKYMKEEGIDAGGLFRDWVESVCHRLSLNTVERTGVITSDFLLTQCTPLENLMEFGPDGGLLPKGRDPVYSEKLWRMQMFGIGRMLALAATTQTPLPLKMSRTLYKLILGEAITSYDLKRIDPDFYKSRVKLLLEEGGVQKMEEILYDELYFVGMPVSVEEAEEGTGEELVPGGQTMRVTEDNKIEYLKLLIEHYLVGRSREGISLIVEGFKDVIPKSVLRGGGDGGGGGGGDGGGRQNAQSISALDLELIVTGMPDLDVNEWKKHTGGTINQHPILFDWFFDVVDEMDVEHRAKLLSYTCGSSRLPASGFQGLKPTAFHINITGESADMLPSAHTCFNQLDMPPYTSKEQLKKKLFLAIEECQGFGFI